MIRRMLREMVDRAIVGPRPNVPRETRAPGARWTEAQPGSPEPDLTVGLEVDEALPGSLLLDVREPGEYASGVAEGAMLLPMDLVPHHLARLPRDRAITVYCAAGARSFGVAHWLREQGFAGAVSLAPGVSAFGRGLRPPQGSPGARVAVPEGRYDGVDVAPCEGEVIAREGALLRVRVRDDQGFWVELQLSA